MAKGSSAHTAGVQVVDLKEEEDEDDYWDEYVTYKDPDEKEPEKEPVKDLVPLSNDKLWYNWRKIPPEKEPWHKFSRPPSDCFAVMAAAAAKTGQIKLFGDKPTVTETTLARARKDALKKERLDMERKRREEIGALAYYSEWVKAWDKDPSKEAVKKHYEETGEDESVQLIKMFQHQTFAEYRRMMGTDPRIERDPLCMRMAPEQIKSEDLMKELAAGSTTFELRNQNEGRHHASSFASISLAFLGNRKESDGCFTRISSTQLLEWLLMKA